MACRLGILLLGRASAELCSAAILSAARLGDVAQLTLSLEHELPTCSWIATIEDFPFLKFIILSFQFLF